MKCFHHNDIDGKAAGAIVARKTGNYNKADYIMYDYSTPIPSLHQIRTQNQISY